MDDIVKKAIDSIVGRCAAKNVPEVDAALAAAVLRVVVQEPGNVFQTDRQLSDEEMEALIAVCVDRLSEVNNPTVEMLRMQSVFDSSHTEMSDNQEAHRVNIERALQDISKDILEVKKKGDVDAASLFEKILAFTMLRGSLIYAAPGEDAVETEVGVQETSAALESIFPRTEISSFTSLTRRDKLDHLEEMGLITSGIRLYNREAGKGGDTIEDVPRNATNEASALLRLVSDCRESLAAEITLYTTTINRLQFDRATTASGAGKDRLEAELANRQRLHSFLQMYEKECAAQQLVLGNAKGQFENAMTELKRVIRSKTSVPTNEVYPRFISLATLWQQILGVRRRIALLRVATMKLIPFKNSMTPSIDLAQVHMVTGDVARVQAAEVGGLGSWIAPEASHDLPLEFKGFCPWTIACRDGLLLPGDVSIGLVSYDGKYYAFVDNHALSAFKEDPQNFISAVSRAAASTSELATIIGVPRRVAKRSPAEGVQTADGSTQTVTHPVEAHWDETYTWNEWDLRRRALLLVNLRTKATHSTQTDRSAFTRENESQHYVLKDSAAQTAVDAATNVPQPQRYIAGLRGAPETKMKVVDLTLGVRTV